VDSALVVRNWLFGWYLVAFENAAAERSELYGKELINRLSKRLKDKGIKGISPTNLRKFREFYQAYPEIQRTAPDSKRSWTSNNRNGVPTGKPSNACPPGTRAGGIEDPREPVPRSNKMQVCCKVPTLGAYSAPPALKSKSPKPRKEDVNH
jgi:hypothetical protein